MRHIITYVTVFQGNKIHAILGCDNAIAFEGKRLMTLIGTCSNLDRDAPPIFWV